MGSPNARCRGSLALLFAATFVALSLTGSSGAATTRAKGVDVSNWNGTIKWAKVAGAGYSFVFGKATEGTSFNDPTYATNRVGAETAGIVFGGYHFARPAGGGAAGETASGIAQADHFLSFAQPQAGELPPVLDLEVTGGLSPARLQTWTQAWVGEIYARLGVQPFVYSSPAFWNERLSNSTAIAATGAHLWIAHWTSASEPTVPAQNWDGQGWKFWQWTDCLSVPGFAHCVDGDRMNGVHPSAATIPQFPTGLPVSATIPTIVGPPEGGKRLAAVPGTWTGGKPVVFSYEWRRCDAAGANCLAITGATKESYVPVTADVGHSLKLVVTASSATGSLSVASAPTVAVSPAGTPPSSRPANTGPPQILGVAQVGDALTGSVGTWTGAPTKFAYKWRRCNATGTGCVPIPGATKHSYTPTPDDIAATLSLVVTATGPGGAASAHGPPTDVVVPAPLPPASIGSQTVQKGIAGNIQTEDDRATVTWQPGSVPVGLTVSLAAYTGTLSVPGSEVALTAPNLPAKGFSWPLDIGWTQAQPAGTVIGYSTDGTVFYPVSALSPAEPLPAGIPIASYYDAGGLTHVLTRMPVQVAFFESGAWGDPTYTSADGPTIREGGPFRLAPQSDHTVIATTSLSDEEQAKLTATLTAPNGKPVSILGRGSVLGSALQPGVYRSVQTEVDQPGVLKVRLRLNGRTLKPGVYTLRVTSLDPWGRHETFTLRFRH